MRSAVWLAGVLVVSLLFSCQNQENSLKIGRANKTFGKMPALCLAEANEQIRLDKELGQTTDPQKLMNSAAREFDVQLAVQKRLDEEFAKIKGREVPFELAEQLPFRVLSGEVTGWEYLPRKLQLTFRIVPTEEAGGSTDAVVAGSADSLNPGKICFLKCVDREGKVLGAASMRITPTKTAATGAEGEVWEGTYDCAFINPRQHDFSRFSKVVFIPESEFNAVSSELSAEDPKALAGGV